MVDLYGILYNHVQVVDICLNLGPTRLLILACRPILGCVILACRPILAPRCHLVNTIICNEHGWSHACRPILGPTRLLILGQGEL